MLEDYLNLEKNFRANVRRRRLALGWSQNCCSRKAGIKRDRWARIERDRRSPMLKTIFTVARVLGCKPQELLEKDDGP